MTAKQIIGWVLFVGLLVSLGYKLSAGMSSLDDGGGVLFLVFLVGLIIIFAVRRILQS